MEAQALILVRSSLCVYRCDGGQVHHLLSGAASLKDMNGMSHPEEDGSDDISTPQLSQKFVGRIGGSQVGKYQDVRRSAEIAEGVRLFQ